ncbi:MAG: tRNA lysidine(34) synthetase TilS [Aquabacterium sp.]|nr:tRNA lysidine(34) synthetase TilS [Aquabacterium sp.]
MTSSVVAVAFSGGRDSTALLHATACAAQEAGGVDVVALHVHHGISLDADAWLLHAQIFCDGLHAQGLPVKLLSRRVTLPLAGGGSVEALARDARYDALGDMAREVGADLVLLAHHRRDQAETFLLQALRGSGVAGLAAMPRDISRGGVRWVRPWLGHSRESIEAYVAQYGLSFIEDDSNSNTRFARNSLRLRVWPALCAAFPQAEASLAAAASRVADVLPGLAQWRASLLSGVLVDGESAQIDAALWSNLSGAERRESLAHWYREEAGRSLSANWLERLSHEIPGLVFRQQAAHWAPVGLALYRGILTCTVSSDRSACVSNSVVGVQDVVLAPLLMTDQCAHGQFAVPGWSGSLHLDRVACGGVSANQLACVTARPRVGGERLQIGLGRPARSLKKQYQSAAVPAWCRQSPLFYAGSQLLFVPGLGVDARCVAQIGETQWALTWVPDVR